jgi:hypothetical protein
MSRSGYHDDHDDNWSLIRYRNAVSSAIKGKRGQDFLREMVAALDAMPVKELASDSLLNHSTGAVCALGAVGSKRGMDLAELDPDDIETVAAAFGISGAMAREIVYMNDEAAWPEWSENAARRWQRMRDWAQRLTAREAQP